MRRAKSFMVRKNKYNPDSDDNNNNEQQLQQQQQQKGHFINLKRSHTKLVRRKSSSFDNVLLLQDIKSNNLYLRQQKKYDSDEILVDKMQENHQQQAKQHWGRIRELIGKYESQPIDNNNNNSRTTERSNYKKLQKRISISLDETIFPLPNQTEIRTRKTNNNNNNNNSDIGETSRIRGSFQRIHTVDVLRELMTNFENGGGGGGGGANGNNTNKLPKIPIPTKEELEGVELRSRNVTTNQQQQQRSIRSQTVNFDSSRTKNEQSFEIKGPFKIIINNEKCAKININQKLILSNNQLRIVEILSDDLLIINKLNGNSPQQQRRRKQQQQQQQQKQQNEIILENNVEFRKNTIKLINKKDIEIKDVNNRQYLIQFEINKDAKQFYDIINDTQTKITIKTKLLRLLGMRSSRDLLESKGILKNEPIFGNTINDIYYINNNQQQQQQIPEFLIKIIELIELPTNIKSLGIYRTSGNLAIIQKIRFEIDNGNINILNDYKDDVDVLTGCLKLFFRELKTLIIPEDVFQQLINLLINNNNNNNSNQQHQLENKEIFNHLDKIINENLPKPNREILTYLLKHLVKVDEFNQFNKMDIHNLSICWGPSLINNLSGGQENCCLNLVSQTNQITRIMEYLILYQKQLINNSNNNNNNILKIINNNNNEDEVQTVQIYESIKKLIDLIEININTEGIYKKSGSEERKRWILQKIKQNQLDDLNLNNNNNDNCNGIDVHDYCSALKKYLTTLKKPLISIEMQEQFFKDCDNLDKKQLCENLRKTMDSSSNRDALILLLRHIKRVQQYNNISIPYLLHYWTITLITPIDRNNLDRIEKFQYLLELLIELVDNNSQLPDLILINNQQQQQQQQRGSIYDNVFREATFLDDNKTDTKL